MTRMDRAIRELLEDEELQYAAEKQYDSEAVLRALEYCCPRKNLGMASVLTQYGRLELIRIPVGLRSTRKEWRLYNNRISRAKLMEMGLEPRCKITTN